MGTAPKVMPGSKQNWREIKAPEQFKWTRVGESVIAVLRNIEPTMVKGKPNVEYTLELENHQRITMLETADLKKKLGPEYLGYWLNIRYEKDERFESQSADQSAMKVFKVMVGDKAEEAA